MDLADNAVQESVGVDSLLATLEQQPVATADAQARNLRPNRARR
jgi:hypothetical protein